MELKLKAGQFYGLTSQALTTNGFRFTEKSYSLHSSLPRHSHELSHFCFVLAGNYNEMIARKNLSRGPAALVFYPPDVSHSEEHLTRGRHFLIEIDSSSFSRFEAEGVRLSDPALLCDEQSLWMAARMYREFSERDALSALALESLATELLIAASRHSSPSSEREQPPRWLEAAKEYLQENLLVPPSLSEIASAAGVHPTHVARVFRRFERCTVGDYVRKMRIDYARRRMINSSEPLVQIALSAGFADQAHFTRTFKRMTGLTPTEFRRVFGPH